MKILFDAQIFGLQKYGGISRYFSELHNNLNKISHINTEIAVRWTENHHLLQTETQVKPLPFSGYKNYILSGIGRKSSRFMNKFVFLKRQSKNNYDLLHPTYYDTYFLPFVTKPFVVTVYDMIHEKYPEYFSSADTTTAKKRILCENSRLIIAISESTKKDLVDIFNIKPEKIRVIPLSGGFDPGHDVFQRKIKGLPDKYILFVGGRENYKNFDNFFEAMIDLLNAENDLHIVCTGSPFNENERLKFNHCGLAARMIHIFVRDDELPSLYTNAILFVFPSEYEGFGIPILEAMSSSCPTLLSNKSSFPEIGGNAALYFNPNCIEEIREAIHSVLYSQEKRKQMIVAGVEQSKLFSWKKMAMETADVYRSILDEGTNIDNAER